MEPTAKDRDEDMTARLGPQDHLCQKCGAYVMCDSDAEIERLTAELETRRLEAHQIYMASAKEIERLTVELDAYKMEEPKATEHLYAVIAERDEARSAIDEAAKLWNSKYSELRTERDRLRAELDNGRALLRQAVRDTHFGLTEAEGLQWLKDTEAALAGAADETTHVHKFHYAGGQLFVCECGATKVEP